MAAVFRALPRSARNLDASAESRSAKRVGECAGRPDEILPSLKLHWHRRDSHLAAIRGPAIASGDDPTLGVSVVEEGIHRSGSPPRQVFLLEALSALSATDRQPGSERLLPNGGPAEVPPALVARVDATAGTASADCSGLARRRPCPVAAGGAATDRHRTRE